VWAPDSVLMLRIREKYTFSRIEPRVLRYTVRSLAAIPSEVSALFLFPIHTFFMLAELFNTRKDVEL
jgi:hypothetical protein